MRHGVVLDPCACHAEAPRQRGRVDERGEPGVEGQRRLAVEREPFAVAPQGGRPAGDRLSGGERTPRLVYRVEGPETLLADRHRSGGALGPAVAAAKRPRGGRGRSGEGLRHTRTSTKNPGNGRRGRSLLAPCFTWRQYAAKHHETSVVSTP